MKFDLRKAYHSLSWVFIQEMLEGLKFPARFIKWEMTCVTTPSCSLNINGSLSGFFHGGKG